MSQSAALLAQLERLHPKKIDLSLGRILRLTEALGSPHKHLPPVIHVAGTNGKGSVIAFLKAIFQAARYSVHVFTSPHLVRFHERIRLAGPRGASEAISEHTLIDILTTAESANGDHPITFFEITTAAAFLAFANHPADVLLLETGLGGRLDATNIVDTPALTILTPISVDHIAFLGDTIEQIAGEKAGILKPGVDCVVAQQTAKASQVIKKRADEIGAPLRTAGRDWESFEQQGRLIYQSEKLLLDLPLPRLVGYHQIDNAGTAIAAVRALSKFKISEAHIADGLTSASWPARLEKLVRGPLHQLTSPGTEIWLDGGHNPAAAQVLARTMAEFEERLPRPLHLICGMMNVKDAEEFFRAFRGLAEYVVTLEIPGVEQSYKADVLAQLAGKTGLSVRPALSLSAAMDYSREKTSEPIRLLICGSLYLAGHIHHLQQSGKLTATRDGNIENQPPKSLGI